MKEVELILPKMGESIAEATITKWLKNEGENIDLDEAVVEIATDKVDSEVPSVTAGVLLKKLFAEGDVAPVGAPIAIIGVGSDSTANASVNNIPSPSVSKAVENIEKDIVHAASQTEVHVFNNSDSSRFYSPLVLNIAKTESISMSELESISGSGSNGRVTKKDVLLYIENRTQTPAVAVTTPTVTPANNVPKASEVASTSVRKEIQGPKITLMPGDENH